MIEKQILDYTDNDFEKLVEKIVKKGSAVLHDQNLTRSLFKNGRSRRAGLLYESRRQSTN